MNYDVHVVCNILKYLNLLEVAVEIVLDCQDHDNFCRDGTILLWFCIQPKFVQQWRTHHSQGWHNSLRLDQIYIVRCCPHSLSLWFLRKENGHYVLLASKITILFFKFYNWFNNQFRLFLSNTVIVVIILNSTNQKYFSMMLTYIKITVQPFFEIILDDKGQLLPLSRGRKVEDLAFLLFGQNVASLVAENNQLVVSFWQWPAVDEWIRASDTDGLMPIVRKWGPKRWTRFLKWVNVRWLLSCKKWFAFTVKLRSCIFLRRTSRVLDL